MCIKIIGSEEKEFNPKQPLEQQIENAHRIVVDYDPQDPNVINISFLHSQMIRLYKNGISCNVDIKINPNNSLHGMKIERQFEKIKLAFDTHEFIKNLAKFQYENDRKLSEMSEMCLGKIDEQ